MTEILLQQQVNSMSYGASMRLLKGVLPRGHKLNAEIIANHTLDIAREMRRTLEDECCFSRETYHMVP